MAAFIEGDINNLGWDIAGDPTSTDFEFVHLLSATYASDNALCFQQQHRSPFCWKAT